MTGYQAKTLKKYIWIKYWYIFNKLSYFLSSVACLLIGVNQEVEGTTLHKETKTQKKQLKLLHKRKIFPIARNISSTETLQYCSHSSRNMVTVNFRPD